ncbi:unnamed protein product [Dimorphilus gyrociliatus]|uniref:unspecific monooxygenase n=1 Tax=Dimorphilus gyrociliatus TaxID=2664684 RepID=A0A7I8WA24_9ANNE|nr:unnamed protein product [Dimorphilus gyrociliatus]
MEAYSLFDMNVGEMVGSSTVYLVIITALLCIVNSIVKKTPLPPGPWNFPVVGSLPWLSINSPHKTLYNMAKTYGNAFYLKFGSIPTLVLNEYQTIHDALVDKSEDFSGRPDLFSFEYASEGKSMSFTGCNRRFWKLHRRLAEKSLKTVMESTLNLASEEARNLAEMFTDNTLDPREQVLWSMAKVKYTLCYGNYKKNLDHFHKMINAVLKVLELHNTGNFLNFIPLARTIFKKRERELKETCDKMMDMTKISEEKHLAEYNRDKIEDAMDALIKIGIDEGRSPLERDRILHTVQDFIGAGLDITYISINWCLQYMAKYPNFQKLVQDEIDQVLEGRPVTPLDQPSMPKTMSFIYEVLRHACVVPFALPHSTVRDTTLQGYRIPKDTFVLVNLFSMTRDIKVFPEPEVFNPNRFIDNGNLNADVLNRFIPCGIGRRRCVGEKLGKTELFLYVVNILQKLNVNQVSEINSTPIFGLVQKPKPFQLNFASRK